MPGYSSDFEENVPGSPARISQGRVLLIVLELWLDCSVAVSWEVQIPIDVVKSMDALLSLTTDSKSRLCTFGVQSLLRTCVHFIAPKDTIHEASHGRSQVRPRIPGNTLDSRFNM